MKIRNDQFYGIKSPFQIANAFNKNINRKVLNAHV